jgi:xylulokinase
MASSGIEPSRVKGISVSSQGITLVPVDENVMPLCHALSWLDVRAEAETEKINADFGADFMFRLTGMTLCPSYTLPKLLWLKANRSDVFDAAYKFLLPMDFLIAKLTGVFVTDRSMATGTMMYDQKKQAWSKEILSCYGVDEDKLPSLAYGGEIAGKVLPEVVGLLGLSPDCTVAVGAQDQKCAAYGVGLKKGTVTVSLGTAAAIEKYWDTLQNTENRGYGWCGYIEPGTYVTEGVISTAGTCLRYVRDLFFRDADYQTLDTEAEDARARGSSLLFHPYMNGVAMPHNWANATGNFHGVTLATMRGDYALAVMEGVAFQLRVFLETMESYGEVDTLVLFGGGAKSPLWCQIIADVTGMEIHVPVTTEAAGAGAAMLAAKAVGDTVSPLAVGVIYRPSARKNAYFEKYKQYRAVETKLWGGEK